jgi:gamma-glutamylputrescine oxidase
MPDDRPEAPQLRGGSETDVVVVGGGFAGLSAALELRELGHDVVLLEQHQIGHGASGRNAGHLTPVIGKDLPTLGKLYGIDRARALVALAERAVGHVESLIERHHIDCAYEPVGNLLAAVHPHQHAVVDRAAAAATRFGADAELLDADALAARGVPPTFSRAVHLRRGGILDPARYVLGLAGAVADAGVDIYEHTPVRGIADGARVAVETPGGIVRAKLVVLATNAWTPALGRLRHTILPIDVTLFRTAPLDGRARDAIDWRGREGIYTAHEMLESYRLTADDRIVGGAKLVRYGFGGRMRGPSDRVTARLLAAFRDRFPALADVEITDVWTGPIAFALDFLPWVGRTGRWENVLYAAGWAGHGIALASYAGPMLVDLLEGADGPGWPLWDRRWMPLPPEPLRWLTVHAITAGLGLLDARTDRAARARS